MPKAEYTVIEYTVPNSFRAGTTGTCFRQEDHTYLEIYNNERTQGDINVFGCEPTLAFYKALLLSKLSRPLVHDDPNVMARLVIAITATRMSIFWSALALAAR